MATKTLGLSGRDYSTLSAWAAYASALSLSADEILEVYNDGGAVVDTTSVVVGGWTANGFSVTIRPASGQGIKDNANKLTNALRWNASNGAALTTSIGYTYGYDFSGANLIVQDLQFRASSSSASATVRAYNGVSIRRCILSKNTGGYVLIQGASGFTLNDSLLINGNGGGVQSGATGVVMNGCTLATITTAGVGFKQSYAVNPVVKNCVFYNFSTDVENTAGAGTTNNATSKASFGGTGWGTSGQTSVTSADFENVSSGTEDFRIKAGSTKLIGTGVSAVGTGFDVVNTTRTAPYSIGAWQASTATGTTLTPGKGALVFTGHQPTVTQAAGGNNAQNPGTGHLVFAGKQMAVARTVGFYSEPMTNENGGLLAITIIPQVTVQRVSDLGVVDFNLKNVSTDAQGRINIRDATGVLVSGNWYCLVTCDAGANPLSGNRAYQAS